MMSGIMKQAATITAVAALAIGACMGAGADTDGSKRVKNGGLSAGDQLPSIKELGKTLGVNFDMVALVDASGLEYFINTGVTSSTSWLGSGAANDATYTTLVMASTSLGGTALADLSDAFDGYNSIAVWATPGDGDGPFDIKGLPLLTAYYGNGVATIEDDGRTVVLNTQAITSIFEGAESEVLVRREVFVPENDEFARWLTFITNSGPTEVVCIVVTFNNLGSDENTIIYQTSSSGPPLLKASAGGGGGVTVSPEDSWVVSYEDFEGQGIHKGDIPNQDPRLGHVFFEVMDISFENFSGDTYWLTVFGIPAGETRIVMNYVTGQPNLADAVAKAEELSNPSKSAHGLDFMSANEINQLVGIDIAPDINPIGTTSVDDGAAYSETPTLSAGTTPIIWSIISPMSPPGDMAIDAVTGEVTWTAEYTASTPAKDVDITIQASGPGGMDTESWTVVVNALAPVINPIADAEISNGQAYSVTPTLSSQGSGVTTWSLARPLSPPGDMAVDATTGVLTWTAESGESGVSVRLTATGDGGSDSVSWIITVLAAAAPRAGGGGDGGDLCFIATAAYGTPMASEIDALRGVRDTYMLETGIGTAFVDSYYRFSPPVANFIAQYPVLRLAVRVLLTPVVLLSKVFLVSPLAGSVLLLAAGLVFMRLYRGARRYRARA